MHANLPDIAKRWERDYAGGGLIPAHEAGIYGLAEGGRTGFFTAGLAQGDDISPGTSASGGTRSGGDGRSQALINIANRPPRYKTVETHVPHTDEIVTTQIRDYYDPEGYQKRAPQDKPTITIGGMGVNLLTFALTGGIDNPLTRQAASKLVKWGADKIGLEKTIDTFVGENFGSIEDMKIKIQERVAKEDLIQSLPRGHPERIQLEGLTKEIITPERDDRGMQDTSIKYENIEDINEDQARRASAEANTILQNVRNPKRDAYLAAFRQKYLMGDTEMAAHGGRIPGYNTGGLSNLFRLKNR